ncbi:uncharacterized protein LOC111702899 isoform X2 [Eurytemora carolleeae]|uniref:uncharacterized protein LOC111702899 isoform X2 n=1 Tax=Eurytemora carolleeae TaxID=1294199 RepID=UPI000C78F804|nr:uncharacterized protein LOC111702899 isoform X2 [Eurytemora carolleeae]|eukprot:XP_023330473.1 uncharacterized protein LOC111702899 isoform X2 [Eurytemora affinis]
MISMGSGCTKQDDSVNFDEEVKDDEGNLDEIDKNNGNMTGETESLSSNCSSRPPTPFSRPVTAAIIARPKTTTIYEQEVMGEEAGDEGVEDGEDVRDEEVEEEPINMINIEEQPIHHRRHLLRSQSRDNSEMDLPRRQSRHMLGAGDDEELQKFKEYMSQKGL